MFETISLVSLSLIRVSLLFSFDLSRKCLTLPLSSLPLLMGPVGILLQFSFPSLNCALAFRSPSLTSNHFKKTQIGAVKTPYVPNSNSNKRIKPVYSPFQSKFLGNFASNHGKVDYVRERGAIHVGVGEDVTSSPDVTREDSNWYLVKEKDVIADVATDPNDDWPKDWTKGLSPQIAYGMLLLSIPIVPVLPKYQYSASIYFTCIALWAIYVGSHRSLKRRQAQKISLQQSFVVPILCSVSLLGFYCVLRFFPDLDIRMFISGYLTFVGALAVGSNFSDLFSSNLSDLNKYSKRIDFPKWLITSDGNPVHVNISPTDILAAIIGVAAAVGSRRAGAPFTLPNFVAVCIVTELLQLLSLNSFLTAATMLSGLLLYDVFWVFGSSQFFGDNVMVTVATSDSFDGPMKLIFPQWNVNSPNPYSILGLGDLAAPGLLMALMLRFDRYRHRQLAPADVADSCADVAGSPADMALENAESAISGTSERQLAEGDKSYFNAAIAAYLAGLVLTIGINAATGAAQPALLYLVPSLLLGIVSLSVIRSETSTLLNYEDDPPLSTLPSPVAVNVVEEKEV